MYILFSIFLVITVFFVIINHFRKKKILCKITEMCQKEKCHLLNTLIEPFGFCCCCKEDIFTSSFDAWQREFGYSALYDKDAPFFNLIFDCEPVYFHYRGKTWLIQWWKGQYGINTGGEIGIYCSDSLLSPDQLPYHFFHSVSNEEILDFSIELYRFGEPFSCICGRHWWLTVFSMGIFTKPSDLSMEISITFPNYEMRDAFLASFFKLGYEPGDVCLCRTNVSFLFCSPHKKNKGFFQKLWVPIAQWKNRMLCSLYQWITKPFVCSYDRLLYLYFYLPPAFKRLISIRKYKGKRRK